MLPRANVIDTDYGRVILFATQDDTSLNLYLHGVWDGITPVLAGKLVEEAPAGRLIVDVGANVGAFTLAMGKRFGNRCHYLAFEPQRFVYYQLCGNIVLNGLATARAENAGLSDRAGTVRMPKIDYRTERNIGAVSFDPEVRRMLAVENRARGAEPPDTVFDDPDGEEVALRTLDERVRDDIRLLKMDVEGMELAVLRGAARSLEASGFPPIVFESWYDMKNDAINRHAGQVIDHLRETGYAVQVIQGVGIAQHRQHPTMIAFSREVVNGSLTCAKVPSASVD